MLSAGGGYFDAMTGSKVNSNELVAALINRKDSFEEGYCAVPAHRTEKSSHAALLSFRHACKDFPVRILYTCFGMYLCLLFHFPTHQTYINFTLL